MFDLAATLPSIAPTIGDLLRPEFRLGFLSCVDGGVCAGQARDYFEFRQDQHDQEHLPLLGVCVARNLDLPHVSELALRGRFQRVIGSPRTPS